MLKVLVKKKKDKGMTQVGGENNSMSAKVVQSRSLLPAVIYQPQVYQHNMKLYEPWALHCEMSLISSV